MNENKIDFTATPQYSFLYDTPPADFMSEYFDQFAIIEGIHRELEHTFAGFVVGFVTFAYLRINGTSAHNKLRIPANASLDSLSYDEENNFFVEIFNRYKMICEANTVLHETASILEPYFMAGANKLSEEYQKNIAHDLPLLDWSDKGAANESAAANVDRDTSYTGYIFGPDWKERKLTDHAVGVYVEREQIREVLVERTTDSDYSDLYLQVHHLAPLLNIKADEKLLCSPILYNTYLINTLEQSGWLDNGCEKLIEKHLGNVTAVQSDSVLWAIQTLEVVLCGCNNQLISKAEGLSAIHSKRNNGFDVIFLPEANCESIPDVGPLSVGNIVIEKQTREKGFESNNLYYVAFLYSLLNDNGRMLVRFDEKEEIFLSRENNYEGIYADTDNLLAFFVNNNLIEAIIQAKNCTYMLIVKNRPETKQGKILFYYGQNYGYFVYGQFAQYDQSDSDQENLASFIKNYSCEDIQIKHDEGACIVSNLEIRINDYCLLPKKYIYDFDRITKNAEFQVVRHIAHDLSPKLSTVDSVLKHLVHFIESHELLQEPLQEQFYEGQVLEPVGEAIANARRDILQMHKLIKETRKVVTEEISLEEFNSVNLRDFLEATKKKYTNRNITLDIDCDQDIQYELHETSFAEMIDNFVRNAEIHGFVNGSNRTECKIVIKVTKGENNSNLIVEIKNNGKQLPDELTLDKFISFGTKGKNSPGDGLGGAYIYKVIRAHRGSLEIIRNDKDKESPVNFKITLPNLGESK